MPKNYMKVLDHSLVDYIADSISAECAFHDAQPRVIADLYVRLGTARFKKLVDDMVAAQASFVAFAENELGGLNDEIRFEAGLGRDLAEASGQSAGEGATSGEAAEKDAPSIAGKSGGEA